MSVRAPETDAPASATARSRLDEVLRAGVARRREQEADTGVIVVPTNPRVLLPLPLPQPPLPLDPKKVPGIYQPRSTLRKGLNDILPKTFTEKDQWGNLLTFERDSGGTAALRKVVAPDLHNGWGFPNSVTMFDGSANEEYPTLWVWKGVWFSELFSDPSYVRFDGRGQYLSIVDMSLSMDTLRRLESNIPPALKDANPIPLGIETVIGKLSFTWSYDLQFIAAEFEFAGRWRLKGNPDKLYLEGTDYTGGLHRTLTYTLDPQSGILTAPDALLQITYNVAEKYVHKYVKKSNGDIVFDRGRSTGPVPERKTYTRKEQEDLATYTLAKDVTMYALATVVMLILIRENMTKDQRELAANLFLIAVGMGLLMTVDVDGIQRELFAAEYAAAGAPA